VFYQADAFMNYESSNKRNWSLEFEAPAKKLFKIKSPARHTKKGLPAMAALRVNIRQK
jgi:hypothetical protein